MDFEKFSSLTFFFSCSDILIYIMHFIILFIENELEKPSSPSVKKSEEKGIVVVHEVKCKLYVKVFSYENLFFFLIG